MEYFLQSVEEVGRKLNTSPSGISKEEAHKRLGQFGKNALEAKKKKTIPGMLLRQFTDFMILILIAAAVVSGIFK